VCRSGVKYRVSSNFYAGGVVFSRSRRPRRNGESDSYNEAATAIVADRRRRKRCNAPLECRSGSLRAGSYLCAALGAAEGRSRKERGRREGARRSARVHTPLRYSPVRILGILQRVNTDARWSPPADFFFPLLLIFLHPRDPTAPPSAVSLRSTHSPFLRLPFSSASPSPRLYTRRQTRR